LTSNSRGNSSSRSAARISLGNSSSSRANCGSGSNGADDADRAGGDDIAFGSSANALARAEKLGYREALFIIDATYVRN